MGVSSPNAAPELLAAVKRRSKRIRPLPVPVAESGSLPREPRAVLFDVYGTLLARIGDDHPRPDLRRRAVDAVIRQHALNKTAEELSTMLTAAISHQHAAALARGNANPEVSIEHVWAKLFPGRPAAELREAIVEYEAATHPVWPMPGCRRLLFTLARLGMVLGIISNAQFYTPVFLRALLGVGLEDLGFAPDLCLYSCDYGVAKPDAALFRLARERLRRVGLGEEQAIMVGNDRLNDIEPASRSGFMTVLAALDRRSYGSAPDGHTSVQPDAVIRHLRGLEPLLGVSG